MPRSPQCTNDVAFKARESFAGSTFARESTVGSPGRPRRCVFTERSRSTHSKTLIEVKTSRTVPGRPSFKSVSTYESWTLTKHSLSLKAPRIRLSHNGPRLKTECTQRHHKRRYHTRCRERTDSAFLEQAVSRQSRYSSKPVLSIRNYSTYLFEVPRPAVAVNTNGCPWPISDVRRVYRSAFRSSESKRPTISAVPASA